MNEGLKPYVYSDFCIHDLKVVATINENYFLKNFFFGLGT